jgi:hypothetical protein
VIGANVQGKRFVALHLKVAHHFIERLASGRARRVEDPSAFGAAKTPKTRLFYPYQLLAHSRLCGCASTSSDRMPSSRLRPKDAVFSFRSGVLNGAERKPSPSLEVVEDA